MDTLSDQDVAEAVATLRSEGERFPQFAMLKTIPDQMQQLWDAIKSEDQARINQVGHVLMAVAQTLPTEESKKISETKAVLDQLLSRVELG